jgi:hypothetical protein
MMHVLKNCAACMRSNIKQIVDKKVSGSTFTKKTHYRSQTLVRWMTPTEKKTKKFVL